MATTKRRQAPATFRCLFEIGQDTYSVRPLAAHPEVATRAFRFRKQTGDQAVYDVRLTPDGHAECDCKGFLRWGTPCKHIRTLRAVGMLPQEPPQTAPLARPEGARRPIPHPGPRDGSCAVYGDSPAGEHRLSHNPRGRVIEADFA